MHFVQLLVELDVVEAFAQLVNLVLSVIEVRLVGRLLLLVDPQLSDELLACEILTNFSLCNFSINLETDDLIEVCAFIELSEIGEVVALVVDAIRLAQNLSIVAPLEHELNCIATVNIDAD